jgi:hypothetical protein
MISGVGSVVSTGWSRVVGTFCRLRVTKFVKTFTIKNYLGKHRFALQSGHLFAFFTNFCVKEQKLDRTVPSDACCLLDSDTSYRSVRVRQ